MITFSGTVPNPSCQPYLTHSVRTLPACLLDGASGLADALLMAGDLQKLYRRQIAPAPHRSREVTLLPMTDDEIPGFLAALGVPGIVDAHVHFLPDNVQQAVWRWFDGLTPPWPVTYRSAAAERLKILAAAGIRHHTALAYPHRPGMLRFLNDHTMGLAAAEPAVIPTFTIYPEPGVAEETARCLAAGGRCVKVHLQVGGYDAVDPLLDDAWQQLADAGAPIVLHAGAV